LNLNGSKLSSQLNKLGLIGVDFLGTNSRHEPGFPLGASFDFPYTWSDANGDGIIEKDEVVVGPEMVFIGPGLPQTQVNLSTSVRIGDIAQVYALADYQGDYVSYNNTEGFRCQFATCRARQDVTAPLWDQARHVARDLADVSSDHDYYEDGTFIKLREISLTLFLPQSMASRFRSTGASLTVSGRNMATWTDYTGVDPELNSAGGGDNFGTGEFLTQGIPRYFTARLSLTF
jgi:hypothetical protein